LTDGHSRLMTFFLDNLGSRQTNLDFNEARDDGVVVASAERYANYFCLAADR